MEVDVSSAVRHRTAATFGLASYMELGNKNPSKKHVVISLTLRFLKDFKIFLQMKR